MNQTVNQGFDFGCGAGCGFLLAIVGGPILLTILVMGWAIESGSNSGDAPPPTQDVYPPMQDVYPKRREVSRELLGPPEREDSPDFERYLPTLMRTQAGVEGELHDIDGENVTLRLPSDELTSVPIAWLTERSQQAVAAHKARGSFYRTPGGATPAAGATPPQAETWETLAEQFARGHAGKFFDEAPFMNGELQIPADALPAATDGAGLFLGDGALYFDHSMFPFGAGFDTRAPVSRQEVPTLAATLSLPSVYVELQSRPGGWAVVLGHVAQSLPPDAETRKKDLLEQVEKNSRMIMSQLRAYSSRAATEEAKDEAFDKLVELTEIEIPRVPPKPIRGSREYRDDPEAYKIVLDAYNQAVVAHNQAIDRVVPTAKQAVATVDERKKYVEEEFRRYEGQVRQQNEQGLAALRGQCRRISVSVYRAVEGVSAGESSADADAARAPTPGGAHDLQDNIAKLSAGCEYVVVTTRAYRRLGVDQAED